MRRFALALFVLSACFASLAPVAHATPVLINFAGLNDLQSIGDYYNGGAGPNYGVSFSSNVFALKSVFQGGAGGFNPDPTQTPAMFVMGASGTNVTGVMNVGPGFSSGISFFYTAAFNETVTVWSGANGTGTILATITLSPNNGSCVGFPSYCNWSGVGLSFTGTGKSVTFSGMSNGAGISDITLGSTALVTPEPSTLVLLGAGLIGTSIGGSRRFVRRLFSPAASKIQPREPGTAKI
jgi:hypothetical protein